jgi:hypothetical protein
MCFISVYLSADSLSTICCLRHVCLSAILSLLCSLYSALPLSLLGLLLPLLPLVFTLALSDHCALLLDQHLKSYPNNQGTAHVPGHHVDASPACGVAWVGVA